ncbi:MAG TPA: dienelactone hydrolase family protein [Gammaproteobacteria bacterium]|nr:dienelactone hydrolase family protein [Gammaproteobacteria bacterium]
MCEKDHFEEDLEKYIRAGRVTRRDFGSLTAGAGLAMMLPQAVNAQAVTEKDVEIKTPDGTCDAYFVHPSSGAHAAVVVWPDILGLRPAFRQMGKRLAESGYSVLTVNPFYRSARAPVVQPGAAFDEKTRGVVFPMAQKLNATTHASDAKAFIAWLDQQPQVDKGRKVGTTGYCMGGPITMRTAAAVGDRVGAAASFHGGNLVTQMPDSPHLLVPQIKAKYLFAVAENDDMREPEAKNVLRDAFAKAKLDAEIEVYPAAHGWCPPDSQVYDMAQAEKAWGRMLALFERALA